MIILHSKRHLTAIVYFGRNPGGHTEVPTIRILCPTICHLYLHLLCFIVFPQQRKLEVLSHSKGLGAGRSSQIRTAQGSQARFPGRGPQAQAGIQEEVPKQSFQAEVPTQRFPARGVQARFPLLASTVPKNRFQARFPGT